MVHPELVKIFLRLSVPGAGKEIIWPQWMQVFLLRRTKMESGFDLSVKGPVNIMRRSEIQRAKL